jgi:anti-sigma regulatory factor (Ser/Thr protein kinase)
MDKIYSAVIVNSLDELSRLCHVAHEFMSNANIPSSAIYKIDLSLEELLTNVIKYGYDNQSHHNINVSLKISEDRVILTTQDDSREFDPTIVRDIELQEDILIRKVGGVGLHLTRNMVDSITYCRENGINIVNVIVLFSSSL